MNATAQKPAPAPAPAEPGIGHNNPPMDDKWLASAVTKLRSIGKRLSEPKQLLTASKKVREDWIQFGEILAEAREVIPSNKLFNSWLRENELDGYADRNSRTDAMWLSEMSDDMHDLIPEELHSPKAIRNWYRKTVKEVVASGAGEVKAAREVSDFNEAFVDAMMEGDWEVYKARWEDEQEKVPYAHMSPADAAAVIIKKLAAHDTPGEVFEEVRLAVERGALEPDPEPEPEPEPAEPAEPVEGEPEPVEGE